VIHHRKLREAFCLGCGSGFGWRYCSGELVVIGVWGLGLAVVFLARLSIFIFLNFTVISHIKKKFKFYSNG
jgi:hypothetical protein